MFCNSIHLYYCKTFYENYSSYILIFSSLLNAGFLVGVKTNNFLFIHKILSHNCDLGWISCHILIAFIWIPFKHSYDGYSIYPVHSNFQLIPSRGLPCGSDRSSTLFYMNNWSYLCDSLSDSHQTWY